MADCVDKDPPHVLAVIGDLPTCGVGDLLARKLRLLKQPHSTRKKVRVPVQRGYQRRNRLAAKAKRETLSQLPAEELPRPEAVPLAPATPSVGEVPKRLAETTELSVPLRTSIQKLLPRVLAKAPKELKLKRYAQLSAEDVVYIHEELVEDFGSSDDPIEPPGLRDANLLESAISRQSASFAGHEKYKTIDGLAASVFYGICQNHAFHNGNKRTAVVSLLCYLDRNGFQLEASQDELYELVTSLAAHRLLPNSKADESGQPWTSTESQTPRSNSDGP